MTVGGALRNGRTSSHSWIGLPPAPGAADSEVFALASATLFAWHRRLVARTRLGRTILAVSLRLAIVIFVF